MNFSKTDKKWEKGKNMQRHMLEWASVPSQVTNYYLKKKKRKRYMLRKRGEKLEQKDFSGTSKTLSMNKSRGRLRRSIRKDKMCST